MDGDVAQDIWVLQRQLSDVLREKTRQENAQGLLPPSTGLAGALGFADGHWSGRWVRLPEVALRAGGPAEEPICVRSGAEERAEEAQLPDGVRVAGTRVGGTRRRSADFLRASGRRST
ncbi:hypothetical protein HPB47_016225 [Ixodes persulcatus]|uniref:Uncharacterized protein n=1 Tax=Ixodes persulcatus TaxID=34615 RepID=A0AC60QTY0_IXOPE|nr:hypothetical protein HPB47_016225 [Ixodes persulcatus]